MAVRVPLLTPAQKEKRLAFALKYAKAGRSFWAKLNFSDEKMFHGGAHNTRALVTRKRSERLNQRCLRVSPKRAIQIHVGNYFQQGMGPIRLVKGNLEARNYQEDVKFDIEQMFNADRGHPRRGHIFQQDNAPAHYARSTQDFLANKKISTLV